jgi:hypothetical protein
MRITSSLLRQIIREELELSMDEMALSKSAYYHDVEDTKKLGIDPPGESFDGLDPAKALPNKASYMKRAKMQLERFPLPVNVIWLEGKVGNVETRTLHNAGSVIGQTFTKLFEMKHGSAPDQGDFNILIRGEFADDIRGPDSINYTIHNSFHQLFDGGPFEADFARPLQRLAFEYVERVLPDISDDDEFQDAFRALKQNDINSFGDIDNELGDNNARAFKKIFSNIFKGRTIRLGLAVSIREICNEALNLALMGQINPVKVHADPDNTDILEKMSTIAGRVPGLAMGLAGKTLYAGL